MKKKILVIILIVLIIVAAGVLYWKMTQTQGEGPQNSILNNFIKKKGNKLD